MPIWFSFLVLGCTRDVVVGVEDLPEGESFVLSLDGVRMDHQSAGMWRASSVDMREQHTLQLWYGERECTLDTSTVSGELGFGDWSHQTAWECPGLLGYAMYPVDDLLVGQSEVTVGLWQLLKGEAQEDTCGARCPKSNINWLQALEFSNQMSIAEGLEQCYQNNPTGQVDLKEGCTGYRLPTDEEWSRLSSKDSTRPYADSDSAPLVGWVRENSDLQRHPVCELQRNGYDLCDTTGNVWEWCWDTPERTELRRVRGGGFTSAPDVARLDNAVDFPAHLGAEHIGFRLVRKVPNSNP